MYVFIFSIPYGLLIVIVFIHMFLYVIVNKNDHVFIWLFTMIYFII